MGKVKFKLNRKGVRELLRSDACLQMCKNYAYSAQSRLGDGYDVSYRTGKNRANAEVAAVSHKAIQENLECNTILKSLRG
jgi:hypothetical protein